MHFVSRYTFFQHIEGSELDKSEGYYLYFNQNNIKWIQSGKVTLRTFLDRHIEHQKEAKTNTSSASGSRFYKLYPSKVSGRSKGSTISWGLWESLVLFCAITIDRNDTDK